MSGNNEFGDRPSTVTRFQGLNDGKMLIIVTKAYGPNGESLMDTEHENDFSGEVGIRLKVRQGDKTADVLLSPFYGDPSKFTNGDFVAGEQCELFCPNTNTSLDKIPGLTTEDGGSYYAIYLTDKLQDGESVAINNVWGNTNSRILSESEMLVMLADSDE